VINHEIADELTTTSSRS